MTPLDLARAFLHKAGEDEAVVDLGLSREEISDAVFGFHAQQAAEKCLKAVLALDQERPERAHDLELLIGQCRAAGHDPPELPGIHELSRFAVLQRYPLTAAPEVDRAAVKELVARLRAWAEEIVRAAG